MAELIFQVQKIVYNEIKDWYIHLLFCNFWSSKQV